MLFSVRFWAKNLKNCGRKVYYFNKVKYMIGYKPFTGKYNYDWEAVYNDVKNAGLDADSWIRQEAIEFDDAWGYPIIYLPDEFKHSIKPGLYIGIYDTFTRYSIISDWGKPPFYQFDVTQSKV